MFNKKEYVYLYIYNMKKVSGGGNKFSSLPPKLDTPVNQPSIEPPPPKANNDRVGI
jgi:hypothetical protein